VSVPFLALVMLVRPVVIAPLFDDFGPMQDWWVDGVTGRP
jgi:hypothetical protein